MKKIKRKTILALTLVFSILLISSSFIAISQGGGSKNPKSEYVGYEVEMISGALTTTYVDNSGAPTRIIFESILQDIQEFTLKIGDKVYSYPDDFSLTSTSRTEFNAITGDGFARTEGTLTFKMHGQPTLTYRTVSRVSGLRMLPDATLLTPGDFKVQGNIELAGTNKFSKVEGFGLAESHYIQPEYELLLHHHFGLIKGFPF